MYHAVAANNGVSEIRTLDDQLIADHVPHHAAREIVHEMNQTSSELLQEVADAKRDAECLRAALQHYETLLHELETAQAMGYVDRVQDVILAAFAHTRGTVNTTLYGA